MILLADNAYLYKDENGHYYSDGLYNNDFFIRYTDVFGKIRFTAKIKKIEISYDAKYKEEVDQNQVEVIELPNHHGVLGLIKNLPDVINVIKEAEADCDAYIYRMLQVEGLLCYLFKQAKPYAVEVVNNTKTSSRYHGVLRMVLVQMQKRIINGADAVFYVTERALQKDFPYFGMGFQGACSDIELLDDMIYGPKDYSDVIKRDSIEMIHVANSISGNSKGHFTVLDILQKLKEKGLVVTCSFIGTGPSVEAIKEKASRMGIRDRVAFLGIVTDKRELIETIRSKDIFIFPSKSEGMPRCLIEACAAGLPCLASDVGGISELIPKRYLFGRGNVREYVNAIERLSKAPDELNRMSIENTYTAMKYVKTKLDKKRKTLYSRFQKICVIGK